MSEGATNPWSNEKGDYKCSHTVLLYYTKGLQMELWLIKTLLTGCLRASEANPWQKSRGCLGEAPFEVVNS